jgi:hypothetical protein
MVIPDQCTNCSATCNADEVVLNAYCFQEGSGAMTPATIKAAASDPGLPQGASCAASAPSRIVLACTKR